MFCNIVWFLVKTLLPLDFFVITYNTVAESFIETGVKLFTDFQKRGRKKQETIVRNTRAILRVTYDNATCKC